MIHRMEPLCQTPPWQQALASAFTDVERFVDYLELDRKLLPAAKRAAGQFGLKVPREFAALINKGDPSDPLLRQVLPLDAENQVKAGFMADPVGDMETAVVPGILHKYHGRVLLIANGSCAVHCRYCFRRHFPYPEKTAYRNRWQPAIDYISRASDVDEVILSGGDPLTLTDGRLAELIGRLEQIPHLKRLRIHSRLPVVIPSRLTAALREILSRGRLQPILVLHLNHARELSPALAQGLHPLREAGVTLLNQSVLLKGVNDDTEVLASLSEHLFEAGILPYYLHLLDRVQGAAHFEVPEPRARQLHRSLRDRLSGYLVPRLVREEAGMASKQPIT